MTEENAAVTDPFDALGDYEPEVNKVEEGFPPFKGDFACKVNHARLGVYEGDKEFLVGRLVEREIEVLDGDKQGRRLWKKYYIDAIKGQHKTNKNGDSYYVKSDMEKLTDDMFTAGLKFKDEASLKETLAKFCELTLDVNAGIFKDKETGEPRQKHTIKGVSKGVGAGANTETDAPPAF